MVYCKKCEEIKINKKINKIMKKSGYCRVGQNEPTWGCDKSCKKKKKKKIFKKYKSYKSKPWWKRKQKRIWRKKNPNKKNFEEFKKNVLIIFVRNLNI